MEDKTTRRVIIDPLLMILKSRRVLIAITSLIVGMMVMTVPQLEALHSELLILVVSLALSLIGGLSIEDAVIAAKQSPVRDDTSEQLRATLDAIIDEFLAETDDLLDASSDIENTSPDHSAN